jgi:hypothetical protein
MQDPGTQSEILAALERGAVEVIRFFSSIPAQAFFDGDDARWSPAHHLAHLTLSHKRMGAGFRAGASLEPHPTGRSRPFAEMREAYLAGIAAAPAAVLAANPMAPKMDPALDQPGHVAAYSAANARLLEAARAWTEAELDARALRHPFMGPITAREMLLFCIGHDAHHVEGVRRRLEASSGG